jgi:hypothetical protein
MSNIKLNIVSIAVLSAFAVFLAALAVHTSVLVALLASMIVGATVAQFNGLRHMPTAMATFIVTQNFTAAIIIRLFTARSLDGHLSAPALSYGVAAAFSIIILVAARCIPKTSRFALPEPSATRTITTLAVISLLWGITASVATIAVGGAIPNGGDAVSGAGIFHKHTAFLYLPIILWVSTEAGRRSRITFYAMCVAIGYAALAMLLANQRKIGFDAAIAFALGYLSYHGIPKLRILVPTVIGAALFFGVVSPIISYMRVDVIRMPLAERPSYMVDNFPRYVHDVFTGRPLPEAQRFALMARYLDYAGAGAVVQRINGIQITDYAMNAQRVGFTAEDPFVFGIQQAIPNVLPGEKVRYSQGDYFTWRVGLRPYGVEGHPFVNTLAVGMWSYGPFLGVVITSLLVIAALMLLGALTPRLMPSIWGTFFFISNQNAFAEGDYARYITMMLRNLPELAITIVVLLLISGMGNQRPETVYYRTPPRPVRPARPPRLSPQK